MTAREFVTNHSGPSVELSAQSSLLGDPLFRRELLREIHNNRSLDACGLLRELLQLEIAWRQSGAKGDYTENLYWCAFLLRRVGDLGDVVALWRAKNIDFDSACYFDIQCLVGAGVDETIAYLQGKTDDESKAALDYILEGKACGMLDGLEEWTSWKSQYYLA